MTRTDRLMILGVLAVAVLASLVFLVLPRPNHADVVVQVEDEQVLRFPLRDCQRTEEVIGPVGKSVIEVRGDRARMLSSDCPDKLCVNMGWISRPGQVVVCLPNRVVISIEETR